MTNATMYDMVAHKMKGGCMALHPINVLVTNWEDLGIIDSHRPVTAKRLYYKGRLISPWHSMVERDPCLTGWCSHLKEANVPYVVVKVGSKKFEIWKASR